MTRHITVDQVLDLGPCSDYTRERVESLMPRGYLTPLQVARIPDVEVRWFDRAWLLTRIDINTTVAWALDVATAALMFCPAPPEASIWALLASREAWQRQDVETLRAAASVARAASDASSAADAASYAASAADAASYAASRASDAATYAAFYAASDAADVRQSHLEALARRLT